MIDRDAERVRALMGDLVLAMRERVALMGFVFAISALAFGFALYPSQRQYNATALIQVAGDSLNEALTSLRPAIVGLQAALTEARAIRSSDTIRSALERSGLLGRADFIDPGPGKLDAILESAGLRDPDAAAAERLAEFERMVRETAGATGREVSDVRMLVAIKKVSDALQATPAGQSNVLEVMVSARSPDLAAEIANAVATTFVAQQRERLQARFDLAKRWYVEQIEIARREILRLEREIQSRLLERSRDGITEEGVKAVVDKLTEEIAGVETQILRERNRLAVLRSGAAAADATTIEAAVQHIDVAHIAEYASRLSKGVEDIFVIEERFGRNSEPVRERQVAFERDMRVLRRMIKSYVDSQVGMLTAQEEFLSSLRTEVAHQMALLADIQTASSESAVLETESRLSQERLNDLSARVEDFGNAAELTAAQSEVVGAALAPLEPAGRGLKFRMALAVALAAITAAAAAIVAALGDGRYRDVGRLAADAGLAVGPSLPRFTSGPANASAVGHRQLIVFLEQAAAAAGGPPSMIAVCALGDGAETLALFDAIAAAGAAGRPGCSTALVLTNRPPIWRRHAAPSPADTPARQLVNRSNPADFPLERFTVDLSHGGPAEILQSEIDALFYSLGSSYDLVILCFRTPASARAASIAMTRANVAILAAPWGKANRAALRSMPELGLLANARSTYALLYNTPAFAPNNDG